MARDDGYLVLSEQDNYEVLSVLSEAHKDENLDPATREQASRWIDTLTGRNGVESVAVGKDASIQLVDLLYTISSEAESNLHVQARAVLYHIEDTLKEAQVPQAKRRVNLEGPGR